MAAVPGVRFTGHLVGDSQPVTQQSRVIGRIAFRVFRDPEQDLDCEVRRDDITRGRTGKPVAEVPMHVDMGLGEQALQRSIVAGGSTCSGE